MDSGFRARYDAVLAQWPVPYTGMDLDSRLGTTHVTVCGEQGAPPVVLLAGGRSTSTVWYATVDALATGHRVFALDAIGDAGRSVRSDASMTSLDAWMEWLDATLDGLGIPSAAFVGHSYGGYLATRFALHAPAKVSRLALLDPTDCFNASTVAFRLRAIPLLTGRGFRAFHRWETRGRAVDPAFRELWTGSFDGRGGAITWPKRLSSDEIARLAMPVLVFVAQESRQNDPAALAAGAAALPDGRVVPIAGASHFMLPQEFPQEINPVLVEFLGG